MRNYIGFNLAPDSLDKHLVMDLRFSACTSCMVSASDLYYACVMVGVWFLWLFFFCYPCQCLSWCWPPICPPGCGNSRGMESGGHFNIQGDRPFTGSTPRHPPPHEICFNVPPLLCGGWMLQCGWFANIHAQPSRFDYLSTFILFFLFAISCFFHFALKKSFWAEPSRVLAA